MHCAKCAAKFCKTLSMEGHPTDCPTVGVSFEESLARYTEEEKNFNRQAAKVEHAGYTSYTRVEEIMDFAYRCKLKRIGVVFCTGFSREAAIFCKILQANDFSVESICCKNGNIQKELMGIPDEDKVTPGKFEVICNPAGQAHFINESDCQFAVVMGLCVGHDTIFFAHCKKPFTVLAAKDRYTGHSPVAPLYGAEEGYFKRLFTLLRDRPPIE